MMENTFLNEFDWFRIYTVGLRVLHYPNDFLDSPPTIPMASEVNESGAPRMDGDTL
jgi:hypothetical protein